MDSLKNNDLYQKVVPGFKTAPFEESPAVTQGFLLGLIARGRGSSDSKALKITVDILNGGTALTGSGIALFTTMMIELERELKNNKLRLFVPSKKEESQKRRITCLTEIAYGFNLGMCCENQPTVGSIVEADYVENNGILKEDLEMVAMVGELDPESDYDEDDFDVVFDKFIETIVEIYTLFHRHEKAQCKFSPTFYFLARQQRSLAKLHLFPLTSPILAYLA